MSDSEQKNSATREFKIEHPNLIVCEGNADQQFLMYLIRERKLGAFQVEIAKDNSSEEGSQSKFQSFLQSLEIPLSKDNPLVNLILVSDNDAEPSQSWRSIQKQIVGSGLFNAPKNPLRRARKHEKTKKISLSVLMLPWSGKSGTLEHVILKALEATYPKAKSCVKSYYECMGIKDVTENKEAKIVPQCMIATLSKDDPNCGIGYMWRRKNGFRGLLRHSAFNRIARFLEKFNQVKVPPHGGLLPSFLEPLEGE